VSALLLVLHATHCEWPSQTIPTIFALRPLRTILDDPRGQPPRRPRSRRRPRRGRPRAVLVVVWVSLVGVSDMLMS
jgi:hypothetical protein